MKKLLLLTATVCTMLSCNNNGGIIPEAEKIPINISVGQQTRANDTTFESGDEVGIYVVNYDGSTAGTLAASGNQVDNKLFAYDGSKWTPEQSIYWKDANTAADFYVYYPYSTSPDITAHPFSVLADQSDEEDFWASDFLWGKAAKVSPTPNAVSIQTNHSLSRILVDVKPGEGFTAESWAAATKSVKFCDVKTSATIDLSTGVATVTGDAGEIVPLAAAETGTTLSYKAMMIPQVVADNSKLVVVTVDGSDYIYRKGYEFKANTEHKFTVTVNRSGSNVEMTIGEWTIDSTTNEGVAEIEDESESSIPNNQIWYTATEKVNPYTTDVFGATFVSNDWDSATGKGVITFDGEVTSIGDYAFIGCNITSITIPESVSKIGENAFASTKLSTITIPDSVIEIEKGIFQSCKSLTSITIGNGLSRIENNTFASCSALNTINLPSNITSIGCWAFENSGLTEFTFPTNLQEIGEGAFSGCSSLKKVTSNISGHSLHITLGENSFDSAGLGLDYLERVEGINASSDNLCLIINGVVHAFAGKNLSSYTFPNEVKAIGDGAFKRSKLQILNLRSDMSVYDNAFYNCTELTEVNIPKGTTVNGWNAFYGCTGTLNIDIEYVGGTSDDCFGPFENSSFETVILGPNVKYVVALNCPTYLYCKSTTPPECIANYFRNSFIYVPATALDAYKTAEGWSEFADCIRADSN